MLDGEWPETEGQTGVGQERSNMFSDIASTRFFGNAIEFLVIGRRDFEGDAEIKTELLEVGDVRGIVPKESLIAVHADFKRGTNFDAEGLDAIEE